MGFLSIFPFNKDTFYRIVLDSEHLKGLDPDHYRTYLLDYLHGYLEHLGATFILVENKYVDKDYLIDYSLFYARAFTSYERICRRLHFFSGTHTDSRLESLLSSSNQKLLSELHTDYLGFIVFKPLAERYVGKTVLKPYPARDDVKEVNRFYPSPLQYPASIYGMPFEIKSVAYQEQDKAVCACATVSIWVALHKLRERFGSSLLSPSEITFECGTSLPSASRIFPSEGLEINQVVGFFKRHGYEVQYIDPDPDYYDNDMLKRLIYAYAKYGLPIVLIMGLSRNANREGLHSATILGYNIVFGEKEKQIVNRMPTASIHYESDFIEELYIHDDQVGPFSRCKFGDALYSLDNEWLNYGYSHVFLRKLIIPLYPKIRLSAMPILAYADIIKGLYESVNDREHPYIDRLAVFLTDVNQYKKEIFIEGTGPEKVKTLLKSMPRYIWVIRAKNGERKLFDLLFDATDIKEVPFDTIEHI